MKKLLSYFKENKKTVIKRTLVIGASFAGLIITAGLLKKDRDNTDEYLEHLEELSADYEATHESSIEN